MKFRLDTKQYDIYNFRKKTVYEFKLDGLKLINKVLFNRIKNVIDNDKVFQQHFNCFKIKLLDHRSRVNF